MGDPISYKYLGLQSFDSKQKVQPWWYPLFLKVIYNKVSSSQIETSVA